MPLPQVREATLEDIPQMVNLGGQLLKFSNYRDWPVDWEKVVDLYERLITEPTGIALLTEHGFFLGGIGSMWFSSEPIAQDYAIFVEEGYRGTGEATALIAEYKRRARELGAKRILAGHANGDTECNATRYFQKHGGRAIAVNFVLEEVNDE